MGDDRQTRCPVCDHMNRPSNRFCTQCGSWLGKTPRTGPQLIVLEGEAERAVFEIPEDRATLGRDADNTVVLTDRQISKRHAVILRTDGVYWIEDLNSRNGVYVNGRRIEKRERLFDGSLLKLGSTILRFESSFSITPGETETAMKTEPSGEGP